MAIAQFSGLASGIDSSALIDAIIAAKQKRNDLRKTQIEEIQKESESVVEFKSKVSALSDLIDKFRTANGGGVSKKSTTSDSTVLTSAASASAINATYSVTVTSVADSATGSFDAAYTSDTSTISALGGNITVTVGTGASQTVITQAVAAGSTTLAGFVTEFNSNSSASGKVVASAVNIGTTDSPSYRLLFTTLESGVDEGTLALSSSTAELTATTIDQASDSVFSIGGIGSSITRSTTNISDVLTGVSFSLVDTGSANITVSNDADSSLSSFKEIIEAYNELIQYVNENNVVDRVQGDSSGKSVFASLAKATVDNDFISAFRSAMSSANASGGTSVTIFAELGVLTNRDGTLELKEDKFKAAVQADPTGATGVLNSFADSVAGVDGFIYQYTKVGGLFDIAVTSNNGQIENITAAIEQLNRQTDKIKESLTMTFARLESVTSKLQSQQQGLTSALAGLQ